MTADKFVEYVAEMPPEKLVGIGTKLEALLDKARRIRVQHGVNLDPMCQGSTAAVA